MMTIDEFKTLPKEKKLDQIKYNGLILDAYSRNSEDGLSPKTHGDIYQLHEFWVFLSDDEKMIIPTRKNPLEEQN